MIYPMKLVPVCKDYIWGGEKLKKWGKGLTLSCVAESWELSVHKDGQVTIENGMFAGQKLSDLLAKNKQFLGKSAQSFEMFPVLIKFIDSRQNLSVQVHPSDEYALEHEGQYGKTEVWYIIGAEKGAGIYCGFKRALDISEIKNYIANNTLTNYLNFYEVSAGDVFFIEAGTVHAIGAGLVLCEVQQNSNLTYRIYDYGRLDSDNKPRPLHIDKALQVAKLEPIKLTSCPVRKINNGTIKTIAECKYFTTEEYIIDGNYNFNSDEFYALTIISGEGKFANYDIVFKAGETYFCPAKCVTELSGKFRLLYTTV